MPNNDLQNVFDQSNNSGSARMELMKDKYDIDTKTYQKENEKGYLNALDFLVNQFAPSLTATLNKNTKSQTTKVSDDEDVLLGIKRSNNGLKKMLTNLAVYHKECYTEVGILEGLFSNKKTKGATNSVTSPKQIKDYGLSQTTSDLKEQNPDELKRKRTGRISFKNEEKSKNETKLTCPSTGCSKVYTTKGALMFHIKTKHGSMSSDLCEKISTNLNIMNDCGKREVMTEMNSVKKESLTSFSIMTPVSTRSIAKVKKEKNDTSLEINLPEITAKKALSTASVHERFDKCDQVERVEEFEVFKGPVARMHTLDNKPPKMKSRSKRAQSNSIEEDSESLKRSTICSTAA